MYRCIYYGTKLLREGNIWVLSEDPADLGRTGLNAPRKLQGESNGGFIHLLNSIIFAIIEISSVQHTTD